MLKPVALGFINGGEEIVKSLINNEEINWGKVFTEFGKGCIEGLPINNKILSTASKIILPPLFDYADAKINGKEINLFHSINKSILRETSLKFSKYLIV